MSWRARSKTKIANKKSNTGTGSVNAKVGGQGRGRVIRGAILSRSVCELDTCYNSYGMMPRMRRN